VRTIDPSSGTSELRILCTSANPLHPRGAWLAAGERQDGADTLSQTCKYTPGFDRSVVLDPPSAAALRSPGEPVERALETADALAAGRCEVFQTIVVVAGRQLDLSNDVRMTTWCPPEAPAQGGA
jgi:hypothetical protein